MNLAIIWTYFSRLFYAGSLEKETTDACFIDGTTNSITGNVIETERIYRKGDSS